MLAVREKRVDLSGGSLNHKRAYLASFVHIISVRFRMVREEYTSILFHSTFFGLRFVSVLLRKVTEASLPPCPF